MRINVGRGISLLLLGATATLLAVSCGGSSSNPKQESKTPTIKIQTVDISTKGLESGITDTLRFGVMRQGEQVIKDLRLQNVGEKSMVLLRHVTSCGCVNIEYERKPIASKQSCDVHFTYDSRGQSGWQMKLLEFYFADTANPLKIYIEAEVE